MSKPQGRPLWIVTVLLLLGALALWGGSRFTWFAEFRDGGVRGTVLYAEKGDQRATVLVPLALLALAGVAGMVATGGWARRVLGALLALAGVAAAWAAVNGVSFRFEAGLPSGAILTGRTLALLGGIFVLAGGLLGIKNASVMPRMGARYSAPAKKRSAQDPDTELWDALSKGTDPTTDH